MKNLFLILIFTFSFNTSLFSQDYKNSNASELIETTKNNKKIVKLVCVTWSCCGIGPFGVEIWSDKQCSYIISSGKSQITVLDLKNEDQTVYRKGEILIKDDIVLVDADKSYEAEGNELVMEAGLYKVIDGQVAFEPMVRKVKIKAVCYVVHHQGHIFGHEYSFTSYAVCVFYPSFQNTTKLINGGYAEVDLSTNRELLELANKNDGILSFDDDIIIDEKYIIKAGKYKVQNEKIYTRNVYLK